MKKSLMDMTLRQIIEMFDASIIDDGVIGVDDTVKQSSSIYDLDELEFSNFKADDDDEEKYTSLTRYDD